MIANTQSSQFQFSFCSSLSLSQSVNQVNQRTSSQWLSKVNRFFFLYYESSLECFTRRWCSNTSSWQCVYCTHVIHNSFVRRKTDKVMINYEFRSFYPTPMFLSFFAILINFPRAMSLRETIQFLVCSYVPRLNLESECLMVNCLSWFNPKLMETPTFVIVQPFIQSCFELHVFVFFTSAHWFGRNPRGPRTIRQKAQ